VRRGQVLDVPGGIDDLPDLGVDDESEAAHLVTRAVERLLPQPVAVVDHLLDRERADDRPQVPLDDGVHLAVDRVVAHVEKPPGGVRDRCKVIAHLEEDDALDADRDSLGRDALGDLERRLPDPERQPPHRLEPGQDERALAHHNAEGGRVTAASTDPRAFACSGETAFSPEHTSSPAPLKEGLVGERWVPPRR
jgi:hypothetical protein